MNVGVIFFIRRGEENYQNAGPELHASWLSLRIEKQDHESDPAFATLLYWALPVPSDGSRGTSCGVVIELDDNWPFPVFRKIAESCSIKGFKFRIG